MLGLNRTRHRISADDQKRLFEAVHRPKCRREFPALDLGMVNRENAVVDLHGGTVNSRAG